MDDAKLHGNRRDFLGLAATAAAAGLGAMVPVTGAVAASDSPHTDFTRWLDSISGTHKQLYDMPELNGGFGLVWSWAFFTTGAQAYGLPESDLGVVIVLRHNALPLAFNDSVWAKYKLGEVFKIEDPDTKAPAVRNPYYLKPGGSPGRGRCSAEAHRPRREGRSVQSGHHLLQRHGCQEDGPEARGREKGLDRSGVSRDTDRPVRRGGMQRRGVARLRLRLRGLIECADRLSFAFVRRPAGRRTPSLRWPRADLYSRSE